MKYTYSFLLVSVLVLCFFVVSYGQNQSKTTTFSLKNLQQQIIGSKSLSILQNNAAGKTNHLNKKQTVISTPIQDFESIWKHFQNGIPVKQTQPLSLKKASDTFIPIQILEENWDGSAWQNYTLTTGTYNPDHTISEVKVQSYNGSSWVDSTRELYSYTNGRNTGYVTQHFNGTMWINDSRDSVNYNSNGYETLYLNQTGDSLSWVNVYQLAYTYDSNNYLTNIVFEEWSGSAWVNFEQESIVYNGQGRESSVTLQQWSGSAWQNYSQSVYTYDSNGNETEYDSQVWNGSAWDTHSKYVYTFDSNNYVIEEVDQSWNGSALVNSYDYVYTYDSNGRRITETDKGWNGSAFANSYMYTYTYDSNGRQTNELDQTWNGSAWVNYKQDIDTFDANGNETEYDEQISNGSIWENTYVYTATYNTNNQYVTENEKYYSSQAPFGVLIFEYGYSYTYDSNGNLSVETDQSLNGSTLENTFRYTYTYQDITGIAGNQNTIKKFELSQNYPNPFNPTTMINYSVPTASLVTIKVYDVLGREIATLVNEQKSQGNYSIQFNGSELASGVYFYRMQAGSFVQTKKLMLMK